MKGKIKIGNFLMNSIDNYLNEREEYFFPKSEEEKELELEEQYNDDDFVMKFPVIEEDSSSPILDPEDFRKSNTEPMTYYAKGNGFDLTDNSDLYEVVKLVKDMVDRHLYMRDLTWKVDIAHRKAVFVFTLGNLYYEDEVDDFFLQGVQQYVTGDMMKRYGSLYNIDSEFSKNGTGQNIMTLTVKKRSESGEKNYDKTKRWNS